ncbi:MAG: sulfite exporter TauE/SafE family protein [Alphaproteobacteria bacterium]|nr:sulfite exporter TauE/SafE family protein [Alphaproteobacteria bacterium]
MTFSSILIMVVAGFFGGLANSIAGGASLVTFPALLSIGLPPIIANASNTVALLPGNLLGAFGDRHKLPARDAAFFTGLAIALVGGTLGALLLLISSDQFFSNIVPLLIGVATLIFAFGKDIQRGLATLIGGADNPILRNVLLFPTSVYGGYFGAGVGVMFMALFGATSSLDVRAANANKNVLGFLTNVSAAVIFAWQAVVNWPVALTMLPATAVGGFAGAKLIKVLPASWVRATIITIGTVMTVIYAYRTWA